MKKENIKFKIEVEVIKKYVDSINSVKEPMNKIKEQINKNLIITKQLKDINNMFILIKNILNFYPKEKNKIYIDIIKQIMDNNNGIILTKMLEPLNISRQYLVIMEKDSIIEKVSRGIYIYKDIFEDSYFLFQQKYKKVIYSHMNALYFYKMTEEFPYNYTVTVPFNYHTNFVNEKCNVFYVSNDIYELGVIEIETPSKNKVKVYDKERCICDIIRSKGRMDFEQVKKSIKQYMKSSDKDIAKLSKYAKIMGINKKVMEIVGDIDYE